MKWLLIDAGNSRIKWARFAGGRLARVQALAWNTGSLPRVLARLLRRAGSVDGVLVCSVAGRGFATQLRRAARSAGLPAPRFVRSQRLLGGVRNGYREPWRLGVDRQLAAIGAIHLHHHRPLLLVDVGTALTVDLIDAHGHHLGGAIVPGPELMQRALLEHTVGIRRRATGGAAAGGRAPHGLFAASTRAGLAAGAVHACAALIAQARRLARVRVGAACTLLLAGGAAPRIARLLPGRVHREPDLVIMGLAVLAFESLE